MNPNDAERVQRITEAMSAGQRIDWEKEVRESPALAGILEKLRLLETVGDVMTTSPFEIVGPAHDRQGGAADSLPARDQPGHWGHLQIVEKLDEGNFGEVFRAYDPSLQRDVALKLLRLEPDGDHDRDECLAEARALAQVRHLNVVTVHGADVHDGRVGVWTDLIRGHSLETLLRQHGPLGSREAALIGLDLCRALSAIHSAGLVHGDVKTSNVLREEGGRIVLLDFGTTSRPLENARPEVAGVRGTPIFMAPECLQGEPATPASDIYSLGVLLYRLVSGKYPVEASHLEGLNDQLEKGAFVALRDRRPDLPSDFVGAVERALAPRVADRFESAATLERALLACLGREVEPTNAQGRAAGPEKARAMWLSLAVLVVLVGGVVLFFRSRSPGRTEPSDPGVIPPPQVRADRALGLSAAATLFRKRTGKETAIETGSQVTTGDDLYLTISVTDTACVYVLNEDENGHVYVLFPLRGADKINPLAPGTHRLPGHLGGKPINWQVTSPGRKERLVLVASRTPLRPLEDAIAKFPAAQLRTVPSYGELGPATLDHLRGVGAVSVDSAAERGGSRLETLLSWLHSLDPVTVWIRELELTNPES